MSQFVRGNEEIFESLSSQLPTEQQPTEIKSVDLPSGCSIDDSSINASVSFECFAGRSYFTSPGVTYSLADAKERRVESAEQTFLRLQSEVHELIDNLNAAAGSSAAATAHDVSWKALAEQTSQLLVLLNQTPRHTADDTSLSSLLSNITASTISPNTPQEITSADSNNINSNKDTSSNRHMIQIEKRIACVESALGVTAATAAAATPLLGTLARLEQRLSFLSSDTAQTDTMRNKLQLLKAELDDLNRESAVTNKSGASKSATAAGARLLEAAKRLEGLYEMVSAIESVVSDVPLLLLRLRSLQTMHNDAATVRNRLTALEASAGGLHHQLAANASVLSELAAGFQENFSTLKSNMLQVEERIEALTK